MQQFESLRASSLYCKKCATAMPVREKLLLVLPDKEIYDYLCTGCASSLGQREVTAGELDDGPLAHGTASGCLQNGILNKCVLFFAELARSGYRLSRLYWIQGNTKCPV
jgi:hypothetical protein